MEIEMREQGIVAEDVHCEKQQQPAQVVLNQIHQSVIYLKGLNSQKAQIIDFFNQLLNESQSLTIESKIEIGVQLKWFRYFFDDFSEDENVITKKHIMLKENIFNMYTKYIKEIKSNYYSLFNIDLKYLPNIESSHPPQYDSLKMSLAISQLILYLYYFFLNKHDNIYLTNEMFSEQLNLIDIVSISHIDYIIYVYESFSENSQQQDEEGEYGYQFQVKNYEEEIEQFDNFLQSLEMISQFDDKIIDYIPKFEYLYGFFLAKQQTIEMCQLSSKKKSLFEQYFQDVVEKCIFNCSIPNNKYIEQKQFNFNYMHPYICLNHLTFNQFISISSDLKSINRMQSQYIAFYDKIYSLMINSLNKIFQNNCTIVNDNTKQQSSQQQQLSQKQSQIHKPSLKQSKILVEEKKKKKIELQKCLNLIQETIIVTATAEQQYCKLAEQIITNIT